METILKKIKKENYVQILNEFLSNPKLSWKAKGIFCYLMSKPDNWVVKSDDIINNGMSALKSVKSGLKELRTFGYAKLINPKNKEGKFINRYYIITDVPFRFTNNKTESSLLGLSDNGTLINNKEKLVIKKTRSVISNSLDNDLPSGEKLKNFNNLSQQSETKRNIVNNNFSTIVDVEVINQKESLNRETLEEFPIKKITDIIIEHDPKSSTVDKKNINLQQSVTKKDWNDLTKEEKNIIKLEYKFKDPDIADLYKYQNGKISPELFEKCYI